MEASYDKAKEDFLKVSTLRQSLNEKKLNDKRKKARNNRRNFLNSYKLNTKITGIILNI